MAAPRVTVVVPALDAEPTIGDCLRSLLELSFPAGELELVVVDNGSRDRTAEIAAGFGNRVRVLREPVRGPSAARNRGLAHARGEIVAFTDADCVVEPAWLAELVPPLDDPAVGIVGGTILALHGCNRVEAFGERIHDHRKAIEHFVPPYVITMSWASRRAVLEEAGGFDPALLRGEDCDLSYRILQAGYRAVFAPRAVVRHRNERTVLGLVREGYAHGYHAVAVLRKHARFLEESARAARAHTAGAGDRPARETPLPRRDAFYQRAFELGKAVGKAVGARRSAG